MFERLMTEPRVVPVFEHLLGANYILSTLTSNLIYPGAPEGGYHVDGALGAMPDPLPSFPMTANSLWLLDDFTEGERRNALCAGQPQTEAETASRVDA